MLKESKGYIFNFFVYMPFIGKNGWLSFRKSDPITLSFPYLKAADFYDFLKNYGSNRFISNYLLGVYITVSVIIITALCLLLYTVYINKTQSRRDAIESSRYFIKAITVSSMVKLISLLLFIFIATKKYKVNVYNDDLEAIKVLILILLSIESILFTIFNFILKKYTNIDESNNIKNKNNTSLICFTVVIAVLNLISSSEYLMRQIRIIELFMIIVPILVATLSILFNLNRTELTGTYNDFIEYRKKKQHLLGEYDS